jgi:hypothetical protein
MIQLGVQVEKILNIETPSHKDFNIPYGLKVGNIT